MSRSAFRWWLAGFLATFVSHAACLSVNISKPWVGHHDFNGVIWSQSAHNNLRAGLRTTLGVPTRYTGSLPIPSTGFYVHHPPLLSLLVTGVFAVFGEQEWVARLVPIVCSLASLVLLWLLVWKCLGVRAATLSAFVFTLLPMELYFGRMVNPEPCALVWILAALVCLHHWHVTGKRQWRLAVLACFLAGMWTEWHVHLLAAIVAMALLVGWQRSDTRLAWMLLGLAVATLGLFYLQVQFVRPDASEDMSQAISRWIFWPSDDTPTLGQWGRKMGEVLSGHFSLLAWGLAIWGASVALGRRRSEPGASWLAWAALSISLMNVLYVATFRRASYVHDYALFYFTVPVAIMAGIALEAIVGWVEARGASRILWLTAIGVEVIALAFLGFHGYTKTRELHEKQQFRFFQFSAADSRYLIPVLGKTIRSRFPEEAVVKCNFSGGKRSMPLPFRYYAQRKVRYQGASLAEWQPVFSQPSQTTAAVIWLGAAEAGELVSVLPEGSRDYIQLGNHRFCLWQTQPARQMTEGAQTTEQPDIQARN